MFLIATPIYIDVIIIYLGYAKSHLFITGLAFMTPPPSFAMTYLWLPN